MIIVGLVVIYMVGLFTGVYFVTQIEKDINKRITKN